jgi:hypothetical protein
MSQPTDRNIIEELFTGECDPEPLEEESDQEWAIRCSTLRSYAQEQQRLAEAIDLATALLAPHMNKEPV